MGLPKVARIVSPNVVRETSAGSLTNEGTSHWSLLGGMGTALFLVGMVDLILTWLPFSFGNPEWEFGTVSATLNGMPVPAVGLVLVLSYAYVMRSRWQLRALAVVSVLLAVGVLAAVALYVTDVPLALRSVPDPALRVGLWKAIVKTGLQGVVYPPVFLWLAGNAWRRAASGPTMSL